MATTMESSPSSEPCSVFGRLEDEAWLRVLVKSIDQPVVEGITLPGFPPAEFQALSIGSSGEHALTEAFGFWRIVKEYATRAGVSMSPGTRVLDFGCGWGRMVRFFLKDLRTDDVWGVDVANDMLSFCHQLFPYGHFEQVPPSPPTTLPARAFDAIYAYSVFSHLNEPVHLAWVEEFSRLLRPGGILVATTQGRSFLHFCQELRRDGNATTGWHEALARSFIDLDASLAAYDRGEFLHAATGGGVERPPSFYGETLIPRQYVEHHWTRHLEFMDFKDDRSFLPQALIVMRKG
jgi:SAM-dependent methyltransferase